MFIWEVLLKLDFFIFLEVVELVFMLLEGLNNFGRVCVVA